MRDSARSEAGQRWRGKEAAHWRLRVSFLSLTSLAGALQVAVRCHVFWLRHRRSDHHSTPLPSVMTTSHFSFSLASLARGRFSSSLETRCCFSSSSCCCCCFDNGWLRPLFGFCSRSPCERLRCVPPSSLSSPSSPDRPTNRPPQPLSDDKRDVGGGL